MENELIKTKQLDDIDPFKPLTHLFDMPSNHQGDPYLYFNGNSLEPKPKKTEDALTKESITWGKLGVRGHFDQEHPWISYHELVTTSLARLIGAMPEEVVAMGTLTANLHSAFVSFYRPTPQRFKIIRLAGFPSDTYAIDSQIQQRLATLHDFNGIYPFNLETAVIEICPDDHGYLSLDTFKKTLEIHGDNTAIVWIEAVHFLTGQWFNIKEMTKLAHQKGCYIGLDLAHAIGNVPLALHQWNVDFAVWCSYKYLSAGPGAIGGLYINQKHLKDFHGPRFSGWWGHNKNTRFQMPKKFDPILTAEGWQLSNSNIFSLIALRTALDIFDQIDFIQLREKNKRLVAYLEYLIHKTLGDKVQIITPKNPDERGCQLSLHIKNMNEESEIEKRLLNQGVVCDTRGHLIRVAATGLYHTFVDVFNLVEKLKQVI